MKKLIGLVWNTEDGRLRAAVRLLLHYGVISAFFFVLSQVMGQILVSLYPDVMSWSNRITSPQWVVNDFVTALGVIVITYLCGRFLDKRKFTDFGISINRRWWLDLFFGSALAFLQIGVIFLTEFALGWVKVTDTIVVAKEDASILVGLCLTLLMLIAAGVREEAITRAYQLKNLLEGFNFAGKTASVYIAIFLSAAYFGIQHLMNPSASALSTINLSLAGVLYAFAFVLTGRLALPLGLHVCWNFCEGVIFGYPVSGYVLSTNILATAVNGPELITGGSFGPEAGLIRIPAMLMCAALIAFWVKFHTGEIKPERDLTEPERY